jgi:hypothetical protein
MKNKNHLHPFINNIFLRNSINAALLHNQVYRKGATAVEKKNFKDACKERLNNLGIRYYAWEWDGKRYCDEISNFSVEMSRQFEKCLCEGRLRIGTSQKMISLYLKYLWLDGDSSKKPIFAVVDRQVLRLLGGSTVQSWTRIVDIDRYIDIQKRIDKKAREGGYGDGSTWESEIWGDDEEQGGGNEYGHESENKNFNDILERLPRTITELVETEDGSKIKTLPCGCKQKIPIKVLPGSDRPNSWTSEERKKIVNDFVDSGVIIGKEGKDAIKVSLSRLE